MSCKSIAVVGLAAAAVVSQAGGPARTTNRLAGEKSPYLLQHAANPVDWFPWGEEAFAKARRLQRPIFLSVGYSTCHWCHVMERESFSNREVAEVLNKNFVAIKVDREERPDIDQIYMNFVQQSTGRGGWPLNVFLTPDKKPFFGGTYFPPRPKGGLVGFVDVLQQVATEWADNRERIEGAAERIRSALISLEKPTGERLRPGPAQIETARLWFENAWDTEHGGFGQAPKFPRPAVFSFLLRQPDPTRARQAVEMVRHSLTRMAQGGIHDHVGGGFHRYSTDEKWFLPHFEKMLYDQAQLAVAYLEAYQVTGDAELARVARAIFEYVQRDLAHPAGGFYSAEDADSLVVAGGPEAEGAFYVWSLEQLRQALQEDAVLVADYYGVLAGGNVEKDPFQEFADKNVLAVAVELNPLGERHGLSPGQTRRRLDSARARLRMIREQRPRPLLDDKILTAWNGLMISALCRGYQALGEQSYLVAATRAATFIRDNLWDEDRRRLRRRYRLGEADIDGFLADYAFLSQGLLDLYESSLEPRWLRWALELAAVQQELFAVAAGGFFTAADSDDSLLMRMRDDYDGALPAANSVAALNLFRLGQMTGQSRWTETAQAAVASFPNVWKQRPHSLPLMLTAAGFDAGAARQVLIAGDRGADDTRALLREVHRRFLPHRVILLADGGRLQRELTDELPVLAELRRVQGKATAYLCRNYVCDLPTNEPGVLARQLERTSFATSVEKPG